MLKESKVFTHICRLLAMFSAFPIRFVKDRKVSQPLSRGM